MKREKMHIMAATKKIGNACRRCPEKFVIVLLMVALIGTLFMGNPLFLNNNWMPGLFAQSTNEKTSPPVSCNGCHDFQAKLFKNYPSHHPNSLTSPPEGDLWTKAEAIDDDCKSCHLFDPKKHSRGVIILKDPDIQDTYPYNGETGNIKNFCLSCHDQASASDPTKTVKFFNVGNSPPEIASMWTKGIHGSVKVPNTQKNLDCLECHKHHGSSFPNLGKLKDEESCYTCHSEKQAEFDPGFQSHHHLEPILINNQFLDVLGCGDCHNPHLVNKQNPVTRPGDRTELYLALPASLATATVTDAATGLLISGTPYYTGQTNDAGTPMSNLFCLECHAPNLFVTPRTPWLGAPNISYELTNKEYAAASTVSNFFYAHNHVYATTGGGGGGGSLCATCHTTGGGGTSSIVHTFNGHYTHRDNASCTYCHDPHGTKGTFAGVTQSGITGIQRGHLLEDWFLADSKYANALPAKGGYLATPNGSVSCLANDPFNSCHDVHYIHSSTVKPLKTTTSCNTSACHSSFVPVAARALSDSVPPESPR